MRFGVVAGVLGGVVSLVAPGHAQTAGPPPVAVAPATAPPVPAPAAQFPTDIAPTPAAPASAATAPAPATPAPALASPLAPPPNAVALSAEPKRAESEAARPDWNVGAGVAITAGAGLAGLVGVPLYSAVVERRVGTQTWLAFNLGLAYESHEQQLSPVFGGDVLERETIGVYSSNTSLLVGLRHAFVQKLVEVSLVGSLGVSRQSIWRDGLREGETIAGLQEIPSKQYRVGVLGGLTLERELIEALALRLSLDAASLNFSSSESGGKGASEGAEASSRQAWRAAVLLQAGLQLHFYF